MRIAIDAGSLRGKSGGGVSLRMFKIISHVMAGSDHSIVLFCPGGLTYKDAVHSLLTVHDLIPFFVKEAAYKDEVFFGLYKRDILL